MEIYNCQMDILFYGIKEIPNENMYNILKETLIYLGIKKLEAANLGLVNAHCLPRCVNGAPDEGCKPLPNAIIAKFYTYMTATEYWDYLRIANVSV